MTQMQRMTAVVQRPAMITDRVVVEVPIGATADDPAAAIESAANAGDGQWQHAQGIEFGDESWQFVDLADTAPKPAGTRGRHHRDIATVVVRLTMTQANSWGASVRYLERTFTDPIAVRAFGQAYRYARFLMGGRGPVAAWTAFYRDYGWSLQTMDAHGYSVDIITHQDAWDSRIQAHAPAPARADVADTARTDWWVTVPLTQLMSGMTPAEAIARACQAPEMASGMGWAMVPQQCTADVVALSAQSAL
ncbi:MAG: hypothetical protein INR66_03660 [Gordonia polyisoprenivorans]|nr:hypothetical protein [Gordonia polyisoprenivorans]